MTTLSPNEIQELLSKARSRGEYDQYLKEFMESGDAGRLVDRESGILAGKSADQVKVGLENAKKRTDDNNKLIHGDGALAVKVIKKTEGEGDDKEELVYVIDTSKVAGVEQESQSDAVPA